MLCPLCHTQNRENAKFCKGCGQLLSENAPGIGVAEMSPAAQSSIDTWEQVPQETRTGSAETPPQLEAIDQTAKDAADQPPAQQTTQGAPTVAQNDDISLAPTQILSPDKMIAYQARRWQQEIEQELSGNTVQPRQDIADMPTIAFWSGEFPPVPSAVAEGLHAPPAPAAPEAQPETDAEQSQSASTVNGAQPSSETNTTAAASTTGEPAAPAAVETEDVMESTPPSDNVPGTQQPQQDQQAQPATETAGQFPVLAVGSTVGGRYEITQVLGEEANEHVYQVVDHQGYQRCWNCGSEQNAEGDEFCIDCGAELLNASYIMREFPPSTGGDNEATVLQGAIVNTFVDQGHTFVVEQLQATQSAFPNGVRLVAACDSDAGDVRRSEPNEDSTLVLQLQRVHESMAAPVGLYIVADGMGGHENGQGASRMTIGTIAEHIVRELLTPPLNAEKAGEEPKVLDEDTLVGLLHGAVEDANTAICQLNQREKTDMGSTITGFMIVGDHSYIFNVGDSRTYMLREGILYQLTTDHSLVNQLVSSGLIEPDEVYTHPQRSQIYRSLGDKLNVQIDIFKQQLHPGDILLSCSDGLWEMVRNPQITDILNNAPDPQTACAQLIEAANANGGEDNVSAVVVFVR